ncbi:Protein FORGETTER 1 [Linum grandiflorum]
MAQPSAPPPPPPSLPDGVQVRCAGCRMILTVAPGVVEFVCPTCHMPQMLPPELLSRAHPQPHGQMSTPSPPPQVPAHGIDPTKIQLPCANCKALLNVPHGLARFVCPQCGVDLAVDVSKLKHLLRQPRGPLPSQLPPPPQFAQLPLPPFPAAVPPPTLPEEVNELAIEVEQEEDEGGLVGETFTDYRPPKLSIGLPHPDPIVETSSLSAIQPPEPTYDLKIKDELEHTRALSCLQIETLVYACQRHQQHLPCGNRAGFFVGDGAGVGKGRTIAGLILENWHHGRKKAIWISIGSDLKFDARRDLDDMGAPFIEVHALNKLPYSKLDSKSVGVKDGVVFLTYSSLIASSEKGRSRLQQLVQWFGSEFDGLLVFDECHKAKNLVPEAGSQPTRTGEAVLDIQSKLPEARVVYCSATGASEPRNLGYMVRLGLWGSGTSFADFQKFLGAMEKGGVGALELVAMDMKARGMYVCRTLSYKGAEFEVVEAPLEPDMMGHELDDFISGPRELLLKFVEDNYPLPDKPEPLDGEGDTVELQRKRHSADVPLKGRVRKAAKLKPSKDHESDEESEADSPCDSTESESDDEFQICEICNGESESKRLIRCSCCGQLVHPSCIVPPIADIPSEDWSCQSCTEKTEEFLKARRVYLAELTKRYEAALDRKSKILEIIRLLDLPNNPLDDIIDQVLAVFPYFYISVSSPCVLRVGGPDKVAEMTGRKGMLVRASNGKGVTYQQRNTKDVSMEMVNMHEKQQFMDGKKLVAIISEAGSAGVSLQADRRAINQDTLPVVPPGCSSEKPETTQEFILQAKAALISVGIVRDTVLGNGKDSGKLSGRIIDSDMHDVGRFLNRLLGLPPEIQNRLFELFVRILDLLVHNARIEGNLDSGIIDMRASVIELKGPPKAANAMLEEKQKDGIVGSNDGFYESKREWLGKRHFILAFESTASGLFKIVRPAVGESVREMSLSELRSKYRKLSSLEKACKGWEGEYELSSAQCMHGPKCKIGSFCTVGRRVQEVYILGGIVLPVWGTIEKALSKQGRISHKRLRIVRLETTSDNQRIVGVLVPSGAVEAVLEDLAWVEEVDD